MIVISGALVLVALVLLVVGVVGQSLGFVYGSIAVSLVSLVFLVIGILQRRGEPLPAGGAAPESGDAPATRPEVSTEAVTRVTPARPAGAVPGPRAPEPPAAETAAEEVEVAGTVLVVSGRPRYHVEGCRYLAGKPAEEVDVLDAREEGFTPCGVCKPDEVLAVVPEAAEEPAYEEPAYEQEPVDEEPAYEEPALEPEPAPEPQPAPVALPNRRAAATKATSARRPAARAATRAVPADLPVEPEAAPQEVLPVADLAQEPVEAAPAKATRSRAKKAATASTAAPAAAPKPARKAPAKAAKAPAKAAKAPAKASRAAAAAADSAPATGSNQVVVIPERGRFHRSECRYVRGVGSAELLSKAQATRQGYEACGVCRP